MKSFKRTFLIHFYNQDKSLSLEKQIEQLFPVRKMIIKAKNHRQQLKEIHRRANLVKRNILIIENLKLLKTN